MKKSLEQCGGYAFPCEFGDHGFQCGMTLRDAIAISAMQGRIMALEDPNYQSDETEQARFAYRWADAMLKVRAE